MTTKLLKVTLSAFLMCCSLLVAAQTGNIHGTVRTSDSGPAALVNITLTGTKKGTTVNSKGGYTLNNIKPGNYTLVASYTGLQTQSKQITVKVNETSTADFMLAENNEALQEVVIAKNKTNKFSRKESEYVSRMPLKNLENPQVYSVISHGLMDEQLIVDYKDALWNSAGAIPTASPAGTLGAYVRGFSVNTSVRNGMAAQSWTYVDPVNVERIEVIKGPSGTLFGSSIVSFGGLINQVTKKPFDTFKGEVSTTIGSYDFSRIAADINTPINGDKSVLFRVNTAYQNEGSFQNYGHARTFTFAPSLSYKIDDRLTLLFDLEIFVQNKTQNPYPTFAATLMGTPGFTSMDDVKLDYKMNFGGENIDASVMSRNLYTQADYKISDSWRSTTTVAYSSNHVERSLQLYPLYNTATSVTRRITDFGPRDFNSIDIQQNFTGDFKIGNFRNRIVAGFDVFTYNGKQKYTNQIVYDNIDVSLPFSEIILEKFNQLKATSGVTSSATAKQNIFSAYVSDVFNITDRFNAMLSLRADRFMNKPSVTNNLPGTGDYNQTAFSPKFGLTYQLVKDQLSLFGNYMNGFANVGPVLQPDGTVSMFKPRQANQLEGGLKAEAFDHKLTATVSYYDIKVSNATMTELRNNLNFSVQDGTQRSKGFEAEIISNPLEGLNIIAGYAYNESLVTNTSTIAILGKRVQAAPQNVANFWISYKFQEYIKNIGLGFGANFVSDSYFDAPNTFKIPSYSLYNAAIFYDQPKWRFSLKANNLSNEKYWSSNLSYQMLRQYLGSVTLKF